MLEHKIAQLEERLAHARVIDTDDVDTSVVSVGSVVRLRDVDAKETIEYFIVGSAEANPAEQKLSNESPVGKAIIGRKKGETVEVTTPRGSVDQVQDHGDQGGLVAGGRPRLPRPHQPRRRRSGRGGCCGRRGPVRRTIRRCRRRLHRSAFPTATRSPRVRAATEPLDAGGEAERDAPDRGAGDGPPRDGQARLPRRRRPLGRIQVICDTRRPASSTCTSVTSSASSGGPAKSRRGEPSVLAETRRGARAATRSPLPDTFHGLTDVELRYRKRYLDLLMNEETRDDFVTRARVVTADPACARRGRLRRGRDADPAAALRRRLRPSRSSRTTTSSTPTSTSASPTELYLKRLIVGGLERVYEIGKDFRNEGVSFKHNPEFTMLEWYEAYADYHDTMARIEELVERVAREVLGTTVVTFRGHEIDLEGPWERIRFVEALERARALDARRGRAARLADGARRRHGRGQGLGAARRPCVLATTSSPA